MIGSLVQVPLNLTTGTTILNVRAEVPNSESEILYKIISGPTELFSIDEQSGNISFVADVRERTPGLQKLVVEATSGTVSSSVELDINVLAETSPQADGSEEA